MAKLRKYSEHDIETAYTQMICQLDFVEIAWRQVRLETGILDILLLEKWFNLDYPAFQVIEIKKGEIDEKAYTQLQGYMGQVFNAVMSALREYSTAEIFYYLSPRHICRGTLVGSSINDMTARAVQYAENVCFVEYGLNENGIFDFSATLKPKDEPLSINGPNDLQQAILDVALGFRNKEAYRLNKLHNDGYRLAVEINRNLRGDS